MDGIFDLASFSITNVDERQSLGLVGRVIKYVAMELYPLYSNESGPASFVILCKKEITWMIRKLMDGQHECGLDILITSFWVTN